MNLSEKTEIQVLFFAGLADQASCRSQTCQIDAGSTAASLVAQLEAQHGEFLSQGVRVAVNEEFVDASKTTLAAGDVVALIPPVTGG